MTPPTILLLKTITTLRPHFFEDGKSAVYASFDPHLGQNVMSIDFGHLYWSQTLAKANLSNLLATRPNGVEEPAACIQHDLDREAVDELERAKSILGRAAKQMPTAAELILCFRVLSRCAGIASRYDPGLRVHLARGLVCVEYDQYRLSDILTAAEAPHRTAVGRCFTELLAAVDKPDDPRAAVIKLRNDGELNQVILLASILKTRSPDTLVILDTSGANEQFSFGEWVPMFKNSAPALSRYIDYFIPRQDYGATLRALLEALAAGSRPRLSDSANAVCFIPEAEPTNASPLKVQPIEQAFSHYINTLPQFYLAGQKTIVGRLSPAKCHWAACEFCTINSQHLMPRGRAAFDDSYQHYFEALVKNINEANVVSLILMDEALHPNVLIAFSRALLASATSIVYRARCRFTNDLTAEACKLLYESGCRYLGLGLEAASPRVNRLVNKHMGPPVAYEEVLRNLECAGIRMHVYAILGFPTETREEITSTRDFLIDSIRRFRYLTVSANLFYLMKGSGIAREPGRFNIEHIADTGNVALVLDFSEAERERNREFAEAAAREVYRAEFLPDVDDPTAAEGLWHFIDQTGIFYVQKVVHPKNPFHELAERRNEPLPADFSEQRYEPSYLFWLQDPAGGEDRILCDWVTFNYARIPRWLNDFVVAFDPAISLRENAERLLACHLREPACVAFRALVQSGLFLQRHGNGVREAGPPPAYIFGVSMR